ncbi:hypothetical protein PGTUg99_024568 [Puccinia graminis f. sp. tritici]|uniref:Uncharacterized protein n=1 Tax=Puccinia graminis f. sp. tritici TaxID=56615 RepID=A0A5B0NT40_PUCGR|nr:hypothetical protein PGTUg99_024568 [Puccinia graminis f. sp. tritici]
MRSDTRLAKENRSMGIQDQTNTTRLDQSSGSVLGDQPARWTCEHSSVGRTLEQ